MGRGDHSAGSAHCAAAASAAGPATPPRRAASTIGTRRAASSADCFWDTQKACDWPSTQ